MANHTPGPWRFFLNSASTPDTHCVQVERVEHSDDHSVSIAYLQSYKHLEYDDRAETMANARLIAAAPELLEVATDLLNYAEMYLDLCDNDSPHAELAIRSATAVIAKATGETE